MSIENELKHYGVLGMKWGVRRKSKTSTSIRGALAKRSNKKVDESFKNWDTNSKKRASAIDLGKKATADKLASQKDPSNKELKAQSKKSESEYKKALKGNTTYRKGQVRQEVGKDRARKFLSESKKIQKQISTNPSDKALQKQYSKLMDSYNIERAKARKAPMVAAKRSAKIASIKRARTMAIKSAAVTGGLAIGTASVNALLKKNGKSGISHSTIKNAMDIGKRIMRNAQYLY